MVVRSCRQFVQSRSTQLLYCYVLPNKEVNVVVVRLYSIDAKYRRAEASRSKHNLAGGKYTV